MVDISEAVLPDGSLNEAVVARQEEINKRKNVGRLSLTRFWLNTSAGESFIYKPCKDKEPVQFELWFQTHVLSKMKDVRAPKLLAHLSDEQQRVFWMIYEDIGNIEPTFARSARIQAAEKMVQWHSLPTDTVSPEFKSFMPSIDDALHQLLEGREENEGHLRDIGVSRAQIDALFERLIQMNGNFPSEQVVCHGDYHCLNLLPAAGDLVILDWEFIQINSVYWDFYTLLDMATPRYRIQVDKEIRMDVLNAYIRKRSETGWVPPAGFIPAYHLYSLIYSVGILALVSEDLRQGRFDRETLLVQKQEVTSIIVDCLDVVLAG